mmetsp:Transcript_63500/g.129368  ORF Transcript_63500/g.129368 Transcript_63500/m.129368 type:complete len:481 (+) Transcript_63500:1-1443(+)
MNRHGAQGASAREMAAQHPDVMAVFEAQADQAPKKEDAQEEEDGSVPVEITLRHATTKLERKITVPSTATIRDVKKIIVRLSRRGSWRRIALLTDLGRALHDTEHLNGRSLVIMADVKSAEAQKALDESLPEEERWQRWSVDELKGEAERRGIYLGKEQEKILAGLIEAKRWETLSVQELKAECGRQGLTIEDTPDKEELISQLKKDCSIENMDEAMLAEEMQKLDIPIQDEKERGNLTPEMAMRSRLRQVCRWQKLTHVQLVRACELRHFNVDGKSKEELFNFLKSFKILPKPKPKAEPKPEKPQPKQSPQSSRPQGAASSSSRQQQQQQRQKQAEWEDQGGADDSDDGGFRIHWPPGISEHVKRIAQKYPNFTGVIDLEMNDWADQDIEMYLYSNGFLKPNKNTKKATVPKKLKKEHYKTLGLTEGASAGEVRRAYRRLALVYHPDKNLKDPDSAAENFKNITEAYEALTASFTTDEK